MLSFKRAFLTSSSECEPILNEDSHLVTHLEDVVTFDSDDSISLEGPSCVEALPATCSAESDLIMSCPKSSGVESISNSMRTLTYHPLL